MVELHFNARAVVLALLAPAAISAFSAKPPVTSISFGENIPGKIKIEIPRRPKDPNAVVASPKLSHPLPQAPKKTVVIGGGPTGLATAIMLARRGWHNIEVFDRLAPPPDPDDEGIFSDSARFYLIGLGSRGQKALQQLGAWDDVQRYCSAVVGRKDWSPGAGPDEGNQRIFTDRPYLTQVLARDRLAGVLHRICETEYSNQVTLRYGVECEKVEWAEDGAAEATLTLRPNSCDTAALETARGPAAVGAAEDECPAAEESAAPLRVTTPFLVGADGAARAVAEAMESISEAEVKVTRYEDDNVRIYKTVPFSLPAGFAGPAATAAEAAKDAEANDAAAAEAKEGPAQAAAAVRAGWRGDVNYSSRTKDGRINFDALPANGKGDYCGVLLLRADDELAKPDTDPKDLRKVFDEVLPQFSHLVSDADLDKVARKPPSRLPSFRYVGPRLHHGGSTVLLGDAIHTVKPYFGLGANSALEDVIALQRSLDASSCDAPGPAIAAFSKERGPEAEALVRISRSFDRPGKLGFITFILPLILDGIFHGSMPRLFAPNTIAYLQRDGVSFTQVARRKRRDRLAQAAALALGGAAGLKLASLGLGLAAQHAVGPALKAALAAWEAASGPAQAAARVGLAAAAAAGAGLWGWKVMDKSKHMAPADAVAKGPWDKGGKKSGRSNEDFLMNQRLKQPGAGPPPEPASE